MFRAVYATIIFLSTVIFKIIVSDQQLLSNAKCELLNTWLARTTDYSTSERSTTLKINDKEPKPNTQSTSDALDDSTPLFKHTQASFHTKQESLTETTSSSYTSLDAKSYTTSPLKTATKVTSRQSQAIHEVAEESTITMTTDDTLKSTQDSETSEGYTVRRVSEFESVCSHPQIYVTAISVVNFIYVLCKFPSHPVLTVQAYDASIPHDLLMINVVDAGKDIHPMPGYFHESVMVITENTNTVYVSDRERLCIWKIDTVNNRVGKWLSDLGEEFYLSVANANHLLVLGVSDDVSHLNIYDEDANLVRSVSLSDDFRAPLRAIQKSNGEFIVSHRSTEDNSTCVSFLSIEGKMIDQFKLRETIGFKDAKRFHQISDWRPSHFVIDVFSGSVYIFDDNSWEYNLTDHRAIYINSSEEGHRRIVGVQLTDGRTFTGIQEYDWYVQSVELFYDTDNGYLFVVDSIFLDLYQLNTKTLKGRQLGLHKDATVCRNLCYSAKKNELLFFISYKNTIFLGIHQI